MKKLFLIILLFTLSPLFITGCIMYRPNIQQGNVITPEMVAQLKTGQSADQVRYIMGTPVLNNPLNPNRWYYVYSYQPNHKPLQEQQVILTFNNGVLQKIESTPLRTLSK